MGKKSYKPDKRRRELDRKAKQEAKRLRRQNKAAGGGESSGEDTSYLEYLNPAGMADIEPTDSAEDEDGQNEEEPADEPDAQS